MQPRESSAAKDERLEPLLAGQRLGMDQAVQMMRGGRLRLSPLAWERDKYPHNAKLRPVKATVLIWKAWWRELIRGGY